MGSDKRKSLILDRLLCPVTLVLHPTVYRVNLYLSDPQLRECQSVSEMVAFFNLTLKYRYMSEEMIFEETGCLAPCHKVIQTNKS